MFSELQVTALTLFLTILLAGFVNHTVLLFVRHQIWIRFVVASSSSLLICYIVAVLLGRMAFHSEAWFLDPLSISIYVATILIQSFLIQYFVRSRQP